MAGDDDGEKTEQATDHRRSEARKKGNVARSVDLNSAGNMVAAVAALYFFGSGLCVSLVVMLQRFLGGPALVHINIDSTMIVIESAFESTWGSVISIMGLMVLASLSLNLAQVGFLVSTEALQPSLSRLNPLSGLKRIFSIAGFVKLLVSLAKLGLLVLIAGWTIYSELEHFLAIMRAEEKIIFSDIGFAIISLGIKLALALLILALVDFAFQKWKHEKDLRMSKQEIREEMKQMEGDPQTRQRRKEAHQKLSQAREMHQVPDADVVITNPTHIAVAIKYNPDEMDAPRVVAKGMGEIAARIRAIAAEHNIPIIERKPLARALYRDVKVGHPIPLEMYEVFVEIMAFVYRLSGKKAPNVD